MQSGRAKNQKMSKNRPAQLLVIFFLACSAPSQCPAFIINPFLDIASKYSLLFNKKAEEKYKLIHLQHPIDNNIITLPVSGIQPGKESPDEADEGTATPPEPASFTDFDTSNELPQSDPGTTPEEASFNPNFIDSVLEELTLWLQSNEEVLVLSLDIDGTLLVRWAQEKTKLIRLQRDALQRFRDWLISVSGERVLLIYNTARFYHGVNWEEDMTLEGLPIPHILIHGNGAEVLLARQPTTSIPVLCLLHHQVNALNQALMIYNQTLRITIEPAISLLLLHAGLPRILDFPPLIGSTRTTIFSTNPFTLDFLYQKMLEIHKLLMTDRLITPETTMRCLRLQNPFRLVYCFNPMVNKGMTLMLLMNILQGYLPNLELYTAGDGIDDLPMLLFPLLSEAFIPGVFRNYEHNKIRALRYGISETHLQHSILSWRKGVLPQGNPHAEKVLSQLTCLPEHKPLKAQNLGLFGLLEAIVRDLRPDIKPLLKEKRGE